MNQNPYGLYDFSNKENSRISQKEYILFLEGPLKSLLTLIFQIFKWQSKTIVNLKQLRLVLKKCFRRRNGKRT
jgi:hypothetical protein